tara:strand:- start:11428 stop:11682 length:255 start_codon:yes stop_codon:yes gene_type:complete
MCLVCIEYEKGKLKINEALRNIEEMKEVVGQEHYDETMAFLTQELLKEQWSEYDFGRDIEDSLFEYDFHSGDDDDPWEETGFGD